MSDITDKFDELMACTMFELPEGEKRENAFDMYRALYALLREQERDLTSQAVMLESKDALLDGYREATTLIFQALGIPESELQPTEKAVERIAQLAAAEARGECHWKQVQHSEWGEWDADCGLCWTFEDAGPVENEMQYCPKCGRKLVVDLPEPQEARQ